MDRHIARAESKQAISKPSMFTQDASAKRMTNQAPICSDFAMPQAATTL
jgi:hypothetical protein